jgi:CBS-domain-containing membrane protein
MTGTVADIMNSKLLYIQEGDRLSLARSQIIRFGVTAVPILDEGHRPVGVVSLRDLAREDHLVEARSPVCTVRGEVSLEEGARMLAELGAHHLVVVNEQGIAVGIVSALDFVRALMGTPVTHPPAFEQYGAR